VEKVKGAQAVLTRSRVKRKNERKNPNPHWDVRMGALANRQMKKEGVLEMGKNSITDPSGELLDFQLARNSSRLSENEGEKVLNNGRETLHSLGI